MFRNIRNICLVALSTALVCGAVVAPMGERYNGAQLRFEETAARVVAIEAEVAANEREVDRILGLVNDRSASVYRRALTGGVARRPRLLRLV